MDYDLPDPPTPEEHAEPAPGLTPEEIARQAEDEQALAELNLPSRVITAFVVFLTEDGHWIANSNLIGTEIDKHPDGSMSIKKTGTMPPLDAMQLRRPATMQEIGQACSVIVFDVQNMLIPQFSAQAVVGHAQAIQRQATAQQQMSEILGRINGGGGIVGPGGRSL